jgi:hypothetical protein
MVLEALPRSKIIFATYLPGGNYVPEGKYGFRVSKEE